MFYAGLDLGQRWDHSAIAVVEHTELALLVTHVERVPLGPPDPPRVVPRVRDVVGHGELRGRCAPAVDGTGVGTPIVEMLRAAQLGCEIRAVTITGVEREHAHYSARGAGWNVPKQDLIAGLQMLLERGELRIARRLRDAGSLMRELLAVRSTPWRAGRMRLGADGCGDHDDLLIALCKDKTEGKLVSQMACSVGG